MRGRTRTPRRERGCSRCIGPVGAVASFRGQGCESRDIRAERGDLERRSGGTFELLLEGEVPSIVARASDFGLPKRFERRLPGGSVRVREFGRPLADDLRLRDDAERVRPRLPRAACDHRDEAGRERDGECGCRPASGGSTIRRDTRQELVEPQCEVVVAHRR